ncbi:MAG: DNA repair protein RecO [Candidatus Eremiobacteraeota bacterium]|nr:DNA repair protein RecO [Candidatus Eremiobacteraeota bacterium]
MTQPRAYKAAAIVLRARNLGEADRIFTLFSLEHGKLEAVGKGVRRTKSALAGRLEFMNEVALVLHRGRSLDVITSADLLVSHWNAIVSPQTFAVANSMAELVDAFCEPELAVPPIYELLRGVLRAIERNSDPAALLPRFQLRLLDALGLGPPVDRCSRCGTALGDGNVWLDAESGGLACAACRTAWQTVIALEGPDVQNFRALAAPRSEGAALYARPNVAAAVDTLVTYHLGRRTKSSAVLS